MPKPEPRKYRISQTFRMCLLCGQNVICEIKVRLPPFSLPNEVIKIVETEEDLEEML
jgi:hypothetical protein